MSYSIKRATRPQDLRKYRSVMIVPNGEHVIAVHDGDHPGYMVAEITREDTLQFCLDRGWEHCSPGKTKEQEVPETDYGTVEYFSGLTVWSLQQRLRLGHVDHCLDELLAAERTKPNPRVTAIRAICKRRSICERRAVCKRLQERDG